MELLIVWRLKLRKAAQNCIEPDSSPKQRKTNIAYIALGSNVGNRLEYLRRAVKRIKELLCKGSEIISSSVYETKPFGNKNQSNFLNAVIRIETSYDLIDLFNFLKAVEKELGRRTNHKWGPREIDLDILFFNDEIFSSQEITVPHLGIADRDFVLIPMNEIANDFEHPVLKEKISNICSRIIPENIIERTNLKII